MLFLQSRFTVTLLYILFRENKSCFLYFLLIKAELKQGCNKPLFYAVLRIPVDMPVFNGGDSDSLAVMPENVKENDFPVLLRQG